MKKMTQAEGFKKQAKLHSQLVAARMAKDEVAVRELEAELEKLADG